MKFVFVVVLLGALQLVSSADPKCLSCMCRNYEKPNRNIVEYYLSYYIDQIDKAVPVYLANGEKHLGRCIKKTMQLLEKVTFILRKIQQNFGVDFTKVDAIDEEYDAFKRVFDYFSSFVNNDIKMSLSSSLMYGSSSQLTSNMKMRRNTLQSSLLTLFDIKKCDPKPALSEIFKINGGLLKCVTSSCTDKPSYLTQDLCEYVDNIDSTFCGVLSKCLKSTDIVKCVVDAFAAIEKHLEIVHNSSVKSFQAISDYIDPLRKCLMNITMIQAQTPHMEVENYEKCVNNNAGMPPMGPT